MPLAGLINLNASEPRPYDMAERGCKLPWSAMNAGVTNSSRRDRG